MANSIFHAPSAIARKRTGLSLLEVILALTILGVATTILSQIMTTATNNSLRSESAAQAQLICESKLSEIIAGIMPVQTSTWATAQTDVFGKVWYYSVEIVAAEQQGMIGVAVTVVDDINLTPGQTNQYRLVRAIIDPTLGLDKPPATEEEGSATSSTSSSTAGGVQ